MTATATALAAYARSSAATASPNEVIRMAYERILTACDRAEAAATDRPSGWMQVFHDETTRAQAIIVELTCALAINHDDPAVVDLSIQLGELYRYSLAELVNANVTKTVLPLRAVRTVISGLHSAWVEGVIGG